MSPALLLQFPDAEALVLGGGALGVGALRLQGVEVSEDHRSPKRSSHPRDLVAELKTGQGV